jgi:hypothetical protein
MQRLASEARRSFVVKRVRQRTFELGLFLSEKVSRRALLVRLSKALELPG